MSTSWPKFTSRCKSRLSAIARFCFLGRERWRGEHQKLKSRLDEAEQEVDTLDTRCKLLEQEVQRLQERIRELEDKLSQPQPVRLPIGERPPGHQFGVGMIQLSVNLARKIGLRRTVRALRIFFQWMGTEEERMPTYQAVRDWMQRIGLYRMQNAEKRDGGVWLTDHSNQISKFKVLTVMRVCNLQPGVPLCHEDVEILRLAVGEQWKRENVAKVYQETAKSHGTPRAVNSDGATELRDPTKTLANQGESPIWLADPKHFFANRLESLLKRNAQAKAFFKRLGGTRCALQQTELAHFIPPGLKVKSRFMNLDPTIRWALTVLWHLDHKKSQSRKGISDQRMEDKLGWLRDFAPNIQQWQECLAVISSGLKLLNKEGIFQGVADRFELRISKLAKCSMSRQLVQQAIQYLREQESKLRPGERLTVSTEILESSFALYKQLEGQHSKSGFTSLLLTFPVLLRATTKQEVLAAFAKVKMADVKQWTKDNLPVTLAAKRQLMFREATPKTKKHATPIAVAA